MEKSYTKHPLAKGDFDNAAVPKALVDRIKVSNILLQMKACSMRSMHDKNLCKFCQCQEGKIMERDFLRSRKNKLEENLISSKVENHLLRNNSVTLIGNIAANLPRPSDNPDLIWRKLLKDAQTDA